MVIRRNVSGQTRDYDNDSNLGGSLCETVRKRNDIDNKQKSNVAYVLIIKLTVVRVGKSQYVCMHSIFFLSVFVINIVSFIFTLDGA